MPYISMYMPHIYMDIHGIYMYKYDKNMYIYGIYKNVPYMYNICICHIYIHVYANKP